MASKRRRRRRECTNKDRYPTSEAAGRMLAYLQRIRKARPGMHVYPCDFCGGYHLGRGSKRQRRRRIKAWQWNMGV
jgi:hypothetical protein